MITLRKALGLLIQKIVPDNFVFKIINGDLKGKKWIVNSTTPGTILGLHDEQELIKVIKKDVKEDSVFYDIGANVGFFSLLTSQIVKQGKIISFEPFPENLPYLEKHLVMNDIENVEVHELALSDSKGTTNFYIYNKGHGNITGKIYDIKETITVPKDTIDNLVENNYIPAPSFIKMDVDGGEYLILKGAKRTIEKYKPIFVIETHSQELLDNCLNFLKRRKYKTNLLNIEGKSKKQIHAY